MFDIGFSELLLVAVIGLLVLGPERLPKAAATVGKWIGRARRMANQISQEVDRQIKAEELREKLRQEGDTLGLDKIQQTVDSALQEARKFEHLVERGPQATQPPTEPQILNNQATADPEPAKTGMSPEIQTTPVMAPTQKSATQEPAIQAATSNDTSTNR